MKNWFRPDDRARLLERLERLSPASQALWGSMTAHEVVCHLAEPLRVALGDRKAGRIPSPLGLPGVSAFVVWLMPWPRGAPTAPEFLPGRGMASPTEFERDREALLGLLERFTNTAADFVFGPSPVFGRLDRSSWGRLQWRHLDHHLRQFGL
jgi:hypothetical protein